MNMTPDQKQSLAAKIKALLSKTEDNGATEAEAMSAMAKARELMDKHNLNMSEIEAKAEGFTSWIWSEADRNEKIVMDRMWSGLQALTETRYWNTRVGYNKATKPKFFGLASDVIFAEWLATTMVALVIRSADAYVKTLPKGPSRYYEKKSFMAGMARRISERMYEEAAARRAGRQSVAGHGLVAVDKSKLISAELNAVGIHLRNRGGSQMRTSGSTAAAGAAAGNSATWSKPVNAGGKVLSIGGRS